MKNLPLYLILISLFFNLTLLYTFTSTSHLFLSQFSFSHSLCHNRPNRWGVHLHPGCHQMDCKFRHSSKFFQLPVLRCAFLSWKVLWIYNFPRKDLYNSPYSDFHHFYPYCPCCWELLGRHRFNLLFRFCFNQFPRISLPQMMVIQLAQSYTKVGSATKAPLVLL